MENREFYASGYFPGPWPGEDGGPARLQSPRGLAGPGIRPGEKPRTTRRRLAFGNMLIYGPQNRLYLLHHDILRNRYGIFPSRARLEWLDPHTLKAKAKSPWLKAGPFWPGGVAAHRNGDLYTVYGRFAHRLDLNCKIKQVYKLPHNRPYNSFVILDNGMLVTKEFREEGRSHLSILDPETMLPVCEDIEAPEASVARLSARGNTLYVVGVESVFRYHWSDSAGKLELDPDWKCAYISRTGQTYGWDPVIDEENVWFMDNGKHTYFLKMVGAGVASTPIHYIRVSTKDSSDYTIRKVSVLDYGTCTNPPLYCKERRIFLAFDSGNARLRAYRLGERGVSLTKIWNKDDFACSTHMIHYPDTGEVLTNDYRGFLHGEDSVVLDIETGEEKSRVATGARMQSVIFSAPGLERDYYYLSFDTLMRVYF